MGSVSVAGRIAAVLAVVVAVVLVGILLFGGGAGRDLPHHAKARRPPGAQGVRWRARNVAGRDQARRPVTALNKGSTDVHPALLQA